MFFYTIEVDGKIYAVESNNEQNAKELLTDSLWIRPGEKQATINKMKIVAIEASQMSEPGKEA